MFEPETLRVEERTRKAERLRRISAAAVLRVAEDRMPHRGEMHADLVGSAGTRRSGEERRAREALPDLEPGLRPASGRGPHADPRPRTAERRVHGEPVVPHATAHEPRVRAFGL